MTARRLPARYLPDPDDPVSTLLRGREPQYWEPAGTLIRPWQIELLACYCDLYEEPGLWTGDFRSTLARVADRQSLQPTVMFYGYPTPQLVAERITCLDSQRTWTLPGPGPLLLADLLETLHSDTQRWLLRQEQEAQAEQRQREYEVALGIKRRQELERELKRRAANGLATSAFVKQRLAQSKITKARNERLQKLNEKGATSGWTNGPATLLEPGARREDILSGSECGFTHERIEPHLQDEWGEEFTAYDIDAMIAHAIEG